MVVIAEDVERPDLHDEQSWNHIVPVRVAGAAYLEYPHQESDGKIKVVSEMTDKVAGADMVINIEPSVSHEKVITNCARSSFRASSGVFWEPDGQIGLASIWIRGKEFDDIT